MSAEKRATQRALKAITFRLCSYQFAGRGTIKTRMALRSKLEHRLGSVSFTVSALQGCKLSAHWRLVNGSLR